MTDSSYYKVPAALRYHQLPGSQSMNNFAHMLPASGDPPPLPPLNNRSARTKSLVNSPPPLPPPNMKSGSSNRRRTQYETITSPVRYTSTTAPGGESPPVPSKPPSLPPKRSSQLQSMYDTPRKLQQPTPPTTGTTTRLGDQEDDFEVVSQPMSLRVLTEKHQHEFPLRVKVSSGIFGSTEQETFSDGDLLNLHFVKQSRVAVIEKYGGRCVKVPLNSAAQFGVLYNPEKNSKGAQIGYEFRTAHQLMAQKVMPRIVCALQKCQGSTAESSIEENDILIIDEVKSSRPFGSKHILCTQINDGKMTKKKIPDNCVGCFSTKPSYVKLFLPEIIHHFDLPVQVIVFLTAGYSSDDNILQIGEIVTIAKVDIEKNVIATSALEDDPNSSPFPTVQQDDSCSSPLFDIPIGIPVMEVQIIEPKEDECEKLYEDTRELFENYNPLDKERQIKIGAGDDLYYTAVRDDSQDVGVELIAPESIYSVPSNTPAYKPSSNAPATPPKPTRTTNQSPVQSPKLPRAAHATKQSSKLNQELVHNQPAVAPKPKQTPAVPITPPMPVRSSWNPEEEKISSSPESLNEEYVYALTSDGKDPEALQNSPLYTLMQQMNRAKQHQIDELGRSKEKQIQQLQQQVKSMRGDLDQTRSEHKELMRRVQGETAAKLHSFRLLRGPSNDVDRHKSHFS